MLGIEFSFKKEKSQMGKEEGWLKEVGGLLIFSVDF